MQIWAIDPGSSQSGYAILKADGHDITAIEESGKVENEALARLMAGFYYPDMLAIEMISHYGAGMMPGATTFQTCVWIGRFIETAARDMHLTENKSIHLIYRREEKINLCGSMKAKDKDIRMALADRYAPGQPNYGKGTKKAPGFFYGVSADAWQAVAVGVTAYDIYFKGIKP